MTPLHNKLWQAVVQEASAAQIGISSGCEAELRAFIDQGVSVLDARGDLPNEIDVAEQVLRRFVRDMIADSKAQGWTEVREGSFFRVRAKFCPVFPFC